MTDNKEPEVPFPRIPENLIKELNQRFPESCADLEWSHKQVWYMAGQRAVVRFLNHVYTEQNETTL